MIAKKLKYLLLPLLIIALAHCNTESAGPNPTNPDTTDTLPHKPPVSQNQNKHSGVMMEGFYWNVPGGGRWWDTVEAKIPVLANMAGGYGIDRIWLPPAYKAASGAVSMGYDPYDYYDLGDYYQKGTINTHFGSKRGLIRLINALKKHHISVMEDVVLNHRSGGAKELNPFTKTDTYTNFSGVKSGKLKWRWYDFHPSPVMQHDPGTFGDFPDVCYMCKSVSSQMETWMRWLKNTIGFNGGWRFDFVKGLEPWVITEMKAATGNAFSIGEYFDGNVTKVNNWINSTGTNNVPAAHAFDFPLYFTMVNVFEKTDGSGNIADLINPAKSLAAKRPMKAVTFAANHDTDELVKDKMLAYAFILTYQGYPCIFWKDYFNYGLAKSAGKWGNGINQLVWVRGKLAKGSPTIHLIKSNSGDLLIYGAKGTSTSSPGYIAAINDNPAGWKNPTIQTDNKYLQGKTLKAYAWFSTVKGENKDPQNEQCDASGGVTLSVPPRGYVVYSVNGL